MAKKDFAKVKDVQAYDIVVKISVGQVLVGFRGGVMWA
jgi:hypothetical protein